MKAESAASEGAALEAWRASGRYRCRRAWQLSAKESWKGVANISLENTGERRKGEAAKCTLQYPVLYMWRLMALGEKTEPVLGGFKLCGSRNLA
jgi:hypothetical protein